MSGVGALLHHQGPNLIVTSAHCEVSEGRGEQSAPTLSGVKNVLKTSGQSQTIKQVQRVGVCRPPPPSPRFKLSDVFPAHMFSIVCLLLCVCVFVCYCAPTQGSAACGVSPGLRAHQGSWGGGFPRIITHLCYWSRVTRHHLSVCGRCSDTQSECVFSDRLSSEDESLPPLRVFSEQSLLLHFNNQLKQTAAPQTQKSCHTTLTVKIGSRMRLIFRSASSVKQQLHEHKIITIHLKEIKEPTGKRRIKWTRIKTTQFSQKKSVLRGKTQTVF